MEGKKIRQHDRFYFDTLSGGEAFLEVDWNNYAFQNDVLRIEIVGKGSIVIRREDLETYLLALTRDSSRYMENKSRKVGIKYIPVSNYEYSKYKEWKKQEKYAKKY